MESITITSDLLFAIIGSVITFITALALMLVSYIGKEAIKDLRKLEDDFNQLPVKYVRQDGYVRDMEYIKRLIEKVLDKLDDKADKN